MSDTRAKALVISGGGARGAWGVGVCKALVREKGNDYKYLLGTSTGSLMGPLVLTNHFEELEKAYTSVNQKSIFNVNPFTKRGGIRISKVAWRILNRKKTLGESKPLRDHLIPRFLTKACFEQINSEGKEFVTTVTSITNNRVAFKSTKEVAYEDMLDWIWASANQPVYMSTLHKEGQIWGDGGMKEFLPIVQAIKLGAQHVDVIVHRTEELIEQNWQQKGGSLTLLLRVIQILSINVAEVNISQGKLFIKDGSGVSLTFYYMPQHLAKRMKNTLIFDKDHMAAALKEGFRSVVDQTIHSEDFRVAEDGSLTQVDTVLAF